MADERMAPLVVSEPRPIDLVCPFCGELVRWVNPKKPTEYMCPHEHRSAKAPVIYQEWLAQIALFQRYEVELEIVQSESPAETPI